LLQDHDEQCRYAEALLIVPIYVGELPERPGA
jgi:hypothetical protein